MDGYTDIPIKVAVVCSTIWFFDSAIWMDLD